MNFYAVIIAGGVGKRFWPRSRKLTPKQLLNITAEKSMLRLTVDRLKLSTDISKIIIVTNADQKNGILSEIPELRPENILIEPSGKNTAPAIGLAAIYIEQQDPDAIMGVFPADHIIGDDALFNMYLEQGIHAASHEKALVTFGVVPTRPATGYGYIQFLDQKNKPALKVKTFAEKPDLKTARAFLSSGDFLWNSGMFVWSVKIILSAYGQYLTELYHSLKKIRLVINKDDYQNVLNREWATIRSISIDYGIMEKSNNVRVVKVDFPWNDVGSWDAVYEMSDKDENGNASRGDTIIIDGDKNLVFSDHQNVSIVGVSNLVVISTKDALLIIPRHDTERVKEVVDKLEKNGRKELL
jgi:mannose-1-phosphate guanylyltransferase